MKEDAVRILLVDDDSVDRMAIQRMVRDEGLPYSIKTAESIRECRELLRKGELFDLLLLDYMLDDGTGLDVLAEAGNTPVIFVTGSGDERTAVKAMRMGAYDYVVKDPERNYLAILPLTIENVLARRKNENALRESEEKYRELIEKMQDGVFIIQDEKIQFTNMAFAEMLGYGEDEIRGMPFRNLVAPEDIDMVLDRYRRRQAMEDVPMEYEFRALYRDGVSRIHMNVMVGLINYNGRVASFGTVKNITERKKAEEALRNSKQSLDEAQRIAKTGNWEWNLNTGRIFVSDGTYRILGLGQASLIPNFETILRFVHPDDTDMVIETMNDAISHRRPYDFNYRIVLLDRSEKVVRAKGEVILDENGTPCRVLGTLQDITERVQMEKAILDAKEKAEEATRLKDKFVSLVSHDLGGPLSAIIGFMKFIMSEKKSTLDADTGQMIKAALESGEQMVNIIDDLLNISRLKMGKITPQFRFLDMYYMVVEILGRMGYLATDKELKLINDVPRNTRVYADPVLYKQVLQNIVSNAIKFTGRGGQITFSAPASYDAVLAISDTGVGMEAERLETIFRYEEPTSTPGTGGEKGTGLGLPLTREIMGALGGTLSVTSVPGKGSTFRIELPKVTPRILLVEDDGFSRKYVRKMLESLDVEVLEAVDGKDAVEVMERQKPDLVLSDLEMPNMNGFGLLEYVRSGEKLKDIPFIIITSTEGVEQKDMAFRLGADDFVTKPFTEEEIFPRLRKHLI